MKTGDRVKILARPGKWHSLMYQIGIVQSAGKFTSVVKFGFNSAYEIENEYLFSVEKL